MYIYYIYICKYIIFRMLSLLIPNHVSEENEETNSSFSGFYHGV